MNPPHRQALEKDIKSYTRWTFLSIWMAIACLCAHLASGDRLLGIISLILLGVTAACFYLADEKWREYRHYFSAD